MSFYAVHYAYTTDSAALDAARPAHRDYLRSFVEDGSLAAAGAYVGTDPGALLIFRGDSEGEVRAKVDDDPFQQAGLVEETRIVQWKPALGIFADELLL